MSRDTAGSLILLSIALAAFLGLHFFSERITAGHGLGWDGMIYGDCAQNLTAKLKNREINDYYVKRIVPSAIVHFSLRILGVPRTIPNIIGAFSLFNALLLTFAAGIWLLLAGELRLPIYGKILGCIGLFVNFAVLKHAFYYPVLTDTMAFCLGLCMVYLYLTDRLLPLFVVWLAGCFTWPSAILAGAPLLLFPRSRGGATIAKREVTPAKRALSATAMAVACIIYCIAVLPQNNPGAAYPAALVVLLGSAGLMIKVAYMYFGMHEMAVYENVLTVSFWKQRFSAPRLVLVLVSAVVVFFVARSFAYGSSFSLRMTRAFGLYYFAEGMLHPGKFIIMHIVYFGPVLCFAFFCWKEICRTMNEWGLGLVLCMVTGIVLSTGSESRFLMMYYPVLLVVIVKVLSEKAWGAQALGLLFLIALALSKVWLPLRVPDFSENFSRFPEQMYFMNQGPRVITSMYLLQGIIAAGVFFFIYIYFVRRGRGAGERSGESMLSTMSATSKTHIFEEKR